MRRHRAHYDVIIMSDVSSSEVTCPAGWRPVGKGYCHVITSQNFTAWEGLQWCYERRSFMAYRTGKDITKNDLKDMKQR